MRVTQVIAMLAVAAATPQAQEGAPNLPFSPGERLVYKAEVGALGSLGSAVMSVAPAQEFRGVETWLLHFHYRGRITLLTIEDLTSSWFDPATVSSLRYEKRERSPLSSSREEVDMHRGTRTWRGFQGDSGVMPTDAPLDELSFIYFIRTLPLTDTSAHSFNRHFSADRNPVKVRVLREEKLTVPAGVFDALLVEMTVRDARRYDEEGRVLIHVSNDAARLPLRIESSVKLAGKMVLSLQSWTPGEAQTSAAPAAVRPRR